MLEGGRLREPFVGLAVLEEGRPAGLLLASRSEGCLEVLTLDYDSPAAGFTCWEALYPDLSLTYVEDGRLLGYVAAVRGRTLPEVAGCWLPEDKEAVAVLLAALLRALEKEEADRFLVRAADRRELQLARALLGDAVTAEQYWMDSEKELKEVQA